jgi:hypothetical protein
MHTVRTWYRRDEQNKKTIQNPNKARERNKKEGKKNKIIIIIMNSFSVGGFLSYEETPALLAFTN